MRFSNMLSNRRTIHAMVNRYSTSAAPPVGIERHMDYRPCIRQECYSEHLSPTNRWQGIFVILLFQCSTCPYSIGIDHRYCVTLMRPHHIAKIMELTSLHCVDWLVVFRVMSLVHLLLNIWCNTYLVQANIGILRTTDEFISLTNV